jgi:hypothetical protein
VREPVTVIGDDSQSKGSSTPPARDVLEPLRRTNNYGQQAVTAPSGKR